MLIAPFNDLDTTSAIIERHHHELGGVIVEPFQRIITPRRDSYKAYVKSPNGSPFH